MLTIPVVYDDATKRIAVSEEWAGTVIDERSTMFSVSGIPSDAVSAKLDVKVSIKQANGKTIRPFLILNGIESGTGTAVVPQELFYACKRDLKFIFQLEIMTEEETYASQNWITMKVSPSIVKRASQLPLWDQDQVLVDCYEVDNTKIIFRRFSGEEFSILLSDNPLEWENIKNVPWRDNWSDGTPTDKDIMVESFLHCMFDGKTDILHAIPEWDEKEMYDYRSTVICDHKIYQSKEPYNKGNNPITAKDFWEPISSEGEEPTSFQTVIGDGTNKEFTVTHNLGTQFLSISLIDAMTGKVIIADTTVVDDISIKVKFTSIPALEGIRVVIIPGTVSRTSFVYKQLLPVDTWSIVHNLGRKAMVQIFDENGVQMDANITHVSDNEIVVRFYPTGTPATGFAVIS